MAKKDYAKICTDIIKVCGGESNIANITHCMTRLRVQLHDETMIDKDEAKKISGVLNLIVQGGEYQFVIGQDVPSLFAEFKKHDGIKTGGEIQDNAAAKQDVKAGKGMSLQTSWHLSAVLSLQLFRCLLQAVLPEQF